MLSRKTVFIVGAGASVELKLPAGEGLKEKIVFSLKKDQLHGQAFADTAVREAVFDVCREFPREQQNNELDAIVAAVGDIKGALPFALSIDNYLDAQRDDSRIKWVGKLGIAKAILEAERQSLLVEKGTPMVGTAYSEPSPPKFTSTVPITWHLKLMQLLTSNLPQANIEHVFDDVGFIVFNYDRCLEHFLMVALRRYYSKASDASIARAMGNLRVVHTYGQVGHLPWQSVEPAAAFGSTGAQSLRAISEQIQTFTEAVESGLAQQVKDMVQGAETLVFMGFGFLPQNVELLTVDRPAEAQRVFLTTLGISDNDVQIVEDDLQHMLGKEERGVIHGDPDDTGYELFVERGTCLDLMNNNWLRLTR